MATISVPQQTIPGPRALPLLGWRANMVKLYLNPFAYLRQLHNTYGDVVALARGDSSIVLAFGPAMNFRLLANPDLFEVGAEPWIKLPKDTALGRLMRNNLTLMNGEKHKQDRRLMQPAFHKQQIMRYRDDMVTLTQQTLERWQQKSKVEKNETAIWDLHV